MPSKEAIIEQLSKETGFSEPVCLKVHDALWRLMTEWLMLQPDRPYNIHGFGTFRNIERTEREVYSPFAGGKVWIPSSRTVVFKASRKIKNKLNE